MLSTIEVTETASDLAAVLKVLGKTLGEAGGFMSGNDIEMSVLPGSAGFTIRCGFDRAVLREYISRIHGQADNSQPTDEQMKTLPPDLYEKYRDWKRLGEELRLLEDIEKAKNQPMAGCQSHEVQ